MVILDHGLYRELPSETRLNYCKFWHSLILGNNKDSAFYASKLGIHDGESFGIHAYKNWELFALIVLLRPPRGNSVGYANPGNVLQISLKLN